MSPKVYDPKIQYPTGIVPLQPEPFFEASPEADIGMTSGLDLPHSRTENLTEILPALADKSHRPPINPSSRHDLAYAYTHTHAPTQQQQPYPHQPPLPHQGGTKTKALSGSRPPGPGHRAKAVNLPDPRGVVRDGLRRWAGAATTKQNTARRPSPPDDAARRSHEGKGERPRPKRVKEGWVHRKIKKSYDDGCGSDVLYDLGLHSCMKSFPPQPRAAGNVGWTLMYVALVPGTARREPGN